MKKLEAKIGQVFGRWEVIGFASPKNGRSYVLCKCSCNKHTIREVNLQNLISGKSHSCGCIASETTIRRNIENSNKNTYIKCDGFYIGEDFKHNKFLISEQDYDRVLQHNWILGSNGYMVTSLGRKLNHVTLHRFLFLIWIMVK